jgi:hypothetical protein
VAARAEGPAVDLVECLRAVAPVAAGRAVALRAARSSRKNRRCG